MNEIDDCHVIDETIHAGYIKKRNNQYQVNIGALGINDFQDLKESIELRKEDGRIVFYHRQQGFSDRSSYKAFYLSEKIRFINIWKDYNLKGADDGLCNKGA